MYKITWEKETGGVLLHSRIVDGTLGISPRPVFWEELDLLKLNELGWKYPHTEEPLFDNVQSTLISVDSSSQISRCSASLRCFPSLYLTARELPPVLPLAISLLGCKYLIVFADNCCCYFYSFHRLFNTTLLLH